MRGFLHGPVVESLDHGLVAGRCGHAGPCRRGAAPYAARVPRSRAEACGAETKKRRDRPRTAPAQLLPVTGARDIARVHAICETRNDQRSEEHTSELQSLMRTSYSVFCLKKKTHNK